MSPDCLCVSNMLLLLPQAACCLGLHPPVNNAAAAASSAGAAGSSSLLFSQAMLCLRCREGAFSACGLSTDTMPLMAPGPAPFWQKDSPR